MWLETNGVTRLDREIRGGAGMLRARVLAGDVSGLTPGAGLEGRVLRTMADKTIVSLGEALVALEPLENLETDDAFFARLIRVSPQPLVELRLTREVKAPAASNNDGPVSIARLGSADKSNPGTLSSDRTWEVDGGKTLPLRLHQKFVATVVRSLDGGRYLLDAGGEQIEAAAPLNLGRGTRLLLRVEQLGDTVFLQVLDKVPSVEESLTGILRSKLPNLLPLADSLQFLRSELKELLNGSGLHILESQDRAALQALLGRLSAWTGLQGPLAGEELRRLIQDSGLFYEHKLLATLQARLQAGAPPSAAGEALQQIAALDLKAMLQKAADTLKPAGDDAAAVAGRVISGQLDQIEARQASNILSLQHGGAMTLEIPFPWAGGITTAQLSVRPDGRSPEGGEDSEPDGFSVLFLLDLQGFAETRINARISNDALQAVFYVGGAGPLFHLRRGLPALRRTLEACGFRQVLLEARPLSEMPPEQQRETEPAAVSLPENIRLLNVKV